MTKEEFIQQITLVGVETSMAYIAALRSENPIIESSIEDAFDALSLNLDYRKEYWYRESWNFVNTIYSSQEPDVPKIMHSVIVATLLCHGEALASLNTAAIQYLDEGWENMSKKFYGNRVANSVIWDHRLRLFINVKYSFPMRDH